MRKNDVLNDDERKAVIESLQSAWDYIAHDCYLDMDGKLDPSIVLGRDEVAELSCDRLYVGGIDKDLLKKFRTIGWDTPEMHAIIKEAFPNERYGY